LFCFSRQIVMLVSGVLNIRAWTAKYTTVNYSRSSCRTLALEGEE
jgi:hypothetical protein